MESFGTLADLPADAAPLLETAPFWQVSAGWWTLAVTCARPPGSSPRFLLGRWDGAPAAILPLWAGPGNDLASLTTPYSCAFMPLLAEGMEGEVRQAVFTALARACRGAAITRLDALPAEWDGLDDLRAGARAARLCTLRFDHFGNWYEDVTGLDFQAWLANRPGALRETIRRRLRRAAGQGIARFDLLTRPEEMDRGIAAYESVYARSWKEPEPFDAFNPALMRWAAGQGMLRLGVWWLGDTPVATQFWVVERGQAMVLKLAHDEAFREHSPGTVLTALMLRHLLDVERVREIDFGRGDDPYKQAWTGSRRQRVGLMLVAPWRMRGALVLARHAAGRIRDRMHRTPGRT